MILVEIGSLISTNSVFCCLTGQTRLPVIEKSNLLIKNSQLSFQVYFEQIQVIVVCRDLMSLTLTLLTCRLPILQGGTFSFITPTLAILALPKWQCPAPKASVMLSMQLQNNTSPMQTEDSDEVWMSRMREVCKIFT